MVPAKLAVCVYCIYMCWNERKTNVYIHICIVFPWFGIDIGGTLVKLVYFEPLDLSKDEEQKEGDILRTIRHYLVGNTAYGETGFRDVHMELNAIKIGERRGNLHFIRFPTSQMELFVELCVTRKLHMLTFKVFATGGGAYKFESMVRERLNIGWHKCDELEMLIQGIEFLNENNAGRECYYFEIESKSSSNNQPSNTEQHATNSNNNDLNETMSTHSTSSSSSSNGSSSDDDFNISLSDSTFRKTSYNFANSYPYIVVNIGSGVSILLVKGERKYKRISGTSIGGGTFLGLCCLLTSCSTYEEAIDLATRGNSNKVDKLVKDIYGGDYSRFGLPGNIVASSFGHMNVAEKRDEATREDLARATLQTVLNNIGLIARDCATNYVS